MSIEFLVLGGGGILGFFGGGECRFYFYGREDFSGFRSLFPRKKGKFSSEFFLSRKTVSIAMAQVLSSLIKSAKKKLWPRNKTCENRTCEN